MHPREQAFLEAIINEPDDDVHRLVFSDWLDDHGQSVRAEFIRLQIEQSRVHPLSPSWRDLEKRILEVTQPVDFYNWRTEVETIPIKTTNHRGVFRRGFVEEVPLTVQRYMIDGGRIHARAPVRVLTIDEQSIDTASTGALAQCPHIRNLEEIRLPRWFSDDEPWAPLFESPHLERLSRLELGGQTLTSRTIESLCETGVLARLRSLSIVEALIGPEGIERLADSTDLGKLRELRICRIGAPDEGTIADLFRNPSLTSLEELSLAGFWLGAEDVAGLIELADRLELKRIDVLGCSMRRDVRQRFLQAGLARIPESEIPLDDLEDSELATFFETYGLLHPHRLHLPRGAGPRTIGALRRSGLLKDVTVLNLADAQLDLAPLRDLLWLACRGELVRLEFNGAGLDNALEEALLEISAEQIVVVDGYLSPDIRVRLEERFGSQLQLGPG